MNTAKIWFLTLRPWSFTAAAIPVTLGAVVAAYDGRIDWLLFILTLVGGILLQAGTNLANTYGDYVSGVDTVESSSSRELVDKILEPKSVLKATYIIFALASLIGLYLIHLRGIVILILGVIGIIGGYTYTLGPSPYKYKGLGSILVFFLMGPLMSFGAYYVQTGLFRWAPILASLPIAFLVSAILHSNDLRDLYDDEEAGIKTLATTLGANNSFRLYHFLNVASYIASVILVLTGFIPWIGLLPLLLLPRLLQIAKNTQASWHGDNISLKLLELNAAQFHFMFGTLFILGLILGLMIN